MTINVHQNNTIILCAEVGLGGGGSKWNKGFGWMKGKWKGRGVNLQLLQEAA